LREGGVLMSALWDPLVWMLWCKERSLKRLRFRRCRATMDGERFGYYFREAERPGAALVLVHGLAISPEWWLPLLKRLPLPMAVCAPELFGFGRSPGRRLDASAFNLPLYRRQLERLKAERGLDRMILAGVSLGGWVCLDYALAHPEEVAGLILLAPAGVTLNVTREDLYALRRIFDYETPDEFIRLANEYVLHDPRNIPRWVAWLAVKRSRWNGHKSLLRNLEFSEWVGPRVASIRAPTALIWGCRDKVFPLSLGKEVAARMPRARLFPVEEAGHSYFFEDPVPTTEAFRAALAFVEREA
jgi:pimeloyl-ACP methyl ester carboxylesterase